MVSVYAFDVAEKLIDIEKGISLHDHGDGRGHSSADIS
jgi:hypothetical protein